MKKVNLINASLMVLMALLVSSCSNRSDETTFKEKLNVYLKKDLPVVSIRSNKFAAYFDFSGVYVAYNNPETKETFNGLTQKITSNGNFNIYKLANSEITELTGKLNPAQQFQEIHNINAQNQLYAPIESTLKKITDEGRSAILVTDFEEYTKEGVIYTQAYAAPYFKKWLEGGGDITFYITDYVENTLPKHLYYVVFDSNHHELLKLVEKGLEGLPKNYIRFTLATNAYPMSYSYLSATKGGTYHDGQGDDTVSSSVEDGSDNAFFMLDSLRAESYVFANSWEDIIKNASEQTKDNGADIPFTHLFRNLFIDLSHCDSYEIEGLGVKVYNIQDDFDKYWAYSVAMANKPIIKKEAGETYLDFAGVEAGEPYYDEGTGNLKPEYDYMKEPSKTIEIPDMLDFDDDLFESSYKKDPSKTELGIFFHKGFSGKILQQENPNALLRIDIVPKEVNICDLEKIDSLFGWPGNDCLSASVKSVLQDMKPIGKPIYSYFVRIQ